MSEVSSDNENLSFPLSLNCDQNEIGYEMPKIFYVIYLTY